MGKAARAPAAVGSLVWKAAGLSSLSGYLYARLTRQREKAMFKDRIRNRHKS